MPISKRGSVLVYVLIVIALLSVLSISVLTYVKFHSNYAILSINEKQAYLYAKSGIEYAKSMIKDEVKYQIKEGVTYLYGSIGDISKSGTRPDKPETNQIFVKCTIEVNGSHYHYTIESTGLVLNATDKKLAEDKLQYKGDILSSQIYIDNPIIPEVNGITVFSGTNLDWIKQTGEFNNTVTTSSETVILDAIEKKNDVECINKSNDSNNIYTAKKIYFIDMLTVDNKKELYLKADFIYFAGDIIGDRQDAEINISTNLSTLTGSKISGDFSTDKTYGVIYFATGTKIISNEIEIFKQDAPGAYYYFPTGIDLLNSNDMNNLKKNNKIADVNQLIKLEDELHVNIVPKVQSVNEGIYYDLQ